MLVAPVAVTVITNTFRFELYVTAAPVSPAVIKVATSENEEAPDRSSPVTFCTVPEISTSKPPLVTACNDAKVGDFPPRIQPDPAAVRSRPKYRVLMLFR